MKSAAITTRRDRYFFDTEKCTADKGWSQVDSQQDAWYFGQWANPFTLEYVTFAEGDVAESRAENDAEFISFVERVAQWHKDNDGDGFSRFGIDPGWPGKPHTEAAIARWTELGFADLLH